MPVPQQKQFSFLQKSPTSYGGELLKTRKGRSRGRPLDSKNSIHLVLRSSQAVGAKSFKTKSNTQKLNAICSKFSAKYGVRILSLANVGNHLHFHIQISHRRGYYAFIRAITGAIAMAITGKNRWTTASTKTQKFWDYRPFTRIVYGFRALLTLKNYLEINQLEGLGVSRTQATLLMARLRPLKC